MHPTHRLAHFVIGRRSHGAGIQDDQPGIGSVLRAREPARRQAGLDRRAIRLGCAAAEIPDPESFQFSSVPDAGCRVEVQ